MTTVSHDGRPINLLKYLPQVVQEIKEEQAICSAETEEFGRLYEAISDTINSSFYLYTNELGVARWEKMLGITPAPSDTLENRRFRINARMNADIPYTHRSLEELLDNLCGEGMYKLTITPNDYTIKVAIALSSPTNTDTVEEAIRDLIPANMLLVVENLFTSFAMLSGHTHSELADYTHNQIRMEVSEFE